MNILNTLLLNSYTNVFGKSKTVLSVYPNLCMAIHNTGSRPGNKTVSKTLEELVFLGESNSLFFQTGVCYA